MSDAQTPAIPATVEIDHNFFNAFNEPLFRISPPPEEKPVFAAKLGDQEVSLPLAGIIRELALEEGDSLRVMIETIGESLRFVSALRFGDDIPAEVRTGEASWEPQPEHLEIARQRLTMQLVTWVSGREQMITSAEELQQLFDDPSTKQKVNEAFSKAAEKLGVAGKNEVSNLVEEFASELSYVEALRDRHGELRGLFDKLTNVQKISENQISLMSDINSVVRLIRKPVDEFQAMISKIDSYICEIGDLFQNLDVHRENVREVRDELYVRLGAWQEFIDAWKNVDPAYPQEFNVADGVRDLFHFLAQRYLEVDEWVLISQQLESGQGNRYGGVMVW